MRMISRMLVAGGAVCAAVGCGQLATERAVLSAAEADNPTCPDEQMHVVGPVEVEGSEAVVYKVRVCDRERYYQDMAPEDDQRVFTQTKRPAGVGGNSDLWAETDGVEVPEAPPSSGDEGDELGF